MKFIKTSPPAATPPPPTEESATPARKILVKAPDAQQIVKSSDFTVGKRNYEGQPMRLGGGDAAAFGFEPITSTTRPEGFLMAVGGFDGSGKTALALTAARNKKPLLWLSLTEQTAGDKYMDSILAEAGVNVMRKRLGSKSIDPMQSEMEAKKIYQEALKILYAFYGMDGTILLDNASELYEIGRLAIYGRTAGIQQRDYGAINRDMKSWTHLYAEGDAPTVCIAVSRVEWVYAINPANGQREATDRVELKGHKELMYQCHMAMWAKKTIRGDGGQILGAADKFTAEVLRCKTNNALEGKVYKGKDLDVAALRKAARG